MPGLPGDEWDYTVTQHLIFTDLQPEGLFSIVQAKGNILYMTHRIMKKATPPPTIFFCKLLPDIRVLRVLIL